jgi:hypothetical protein
VRLTDQVNISLDQSLSIENDLGSLVDLDNHVGMGMDVDVDIDDVNTPRTATVRA